MVKLIITTAIGVALLASIAAAEQPHWYPRSVQSADSYLALREEFETRLGRELNSFEAHDVAYLVERNWKEYVPKIVIAFVGVNTLAFRKLAKKAFAKMKKHHEKVGDHTGGSQEQDRRELTGASFYARELDFDIDLIERSWVKWKQERKERKTWKHSQHHGVHRNSIPPETPTTRELGTAQSLYGRDLADFIHTFFYPYGDLKAVKKDRTQKEVTREGAQSENAPEAARRAVYPDSMDIMTRSYYGFDDMD